MSIMRRCFGTIDKTGLLKNTEAGLEFVSFSDEMNFCSLNAAVMEHVAPAWVNRVGDPRHPIIGDRLNNEVGPIIGLRIDADGIVVKTNQ